MYKKILLPIDGSKIAEKAAKEAFELGNLTGAEVIIMTVVEQNQYIGIPAGEAIAQINELLWEEAKDTIKKFSNLNKYDIKTSEKIVEGNPPQEIVKMAEDENTDLIVIGSTGKSGFDKFVLGSVADKVTNKSKCSVLVVH
ncbi:universal stress protein [Methanobrevibacter sp. OttesenSCG-928-I08]|nr:universal stress protein [Methanobrevibacter sp. OttesenSCG-928-I08]